MADANVKVGAVVDVGSLTGEFNSAVDSVNSATQELTVNFKEANNAAREAAGQMREARGAVQLFGEEIGVRVNRHLANFIAQMPLVKTALAAAFSSVAIVGLAEVLGEVESKILDITNDMAGWTAQARELYAENVAGNVKMQHEVLATDNALRSLSTIGLTGLPKIAAEMTNLGASSKETATLSSELNKRLTEHREELEHLTTGWSLLKGIAWRTIDGTNDRVKLLTALTSTEKQTVDELDAALRKMNTEEKARLDAEAAQQQKTDARANTAARIQATKAANDARISYQEAYYRDLYRLGMISLEQEIKDLRDAENEKYAILQHSFDQRRALALQRQKDTGQSATPELTAIGGQESAARFTHTAALNAIDTQGAEQAKQQADAVKEAQINAALQSAQARANIERQSAAELFSIHKISAQQEIQDLLSAENSEYEAQGKAIQQRIALAQQYPEKNKALVISLNGELEALELEHQARMEQIRANGARAELQDRQLLTQNIGAQFEAEKEKEAELTAASQTSITGRITLETNLSNLRKQSIPTLQREVDLMKQLAQAAGDEKMLRSAERFQLEIDKLKQSTQQWSSAITGALAAGLKTFNTSFVQMVEGQKNFVQVVQSAWATIAGDIMSYGLKIGEDWIALHARMLAVHFGWIAQKKGADAADLASQEAMKSAANVAEATGDAGLAAAGTFAWYSAINPPVAPAMAAAAYAEGLGFAGLAAFHGGGVVPMDMPANLKGGEMVLPLNLSQGIQRMIGGDTRSSGGHTFNVSVNSSARNGAELVDELIPHLKRAVRHGKFDF